MNFLFEIQHSATSAVSGLRYMPDFCSALEQASLLQRIDAAPWDDELMRRTQHYGHVYDYRARDLVANDDAQPFPFWLQEMGERLFEAGHFTQVPDQVIVNEYLPGQGITPHIDADMFGETIASISLGSPCMMQFTRPANEVSEQLLLEEGSLLVLSGPARHEWKHGIVPRQSDLVAGMRMYRERRVSLTFRTLV